MNTDDLPTLQKALADLSEIQARLDSLKLDIALILKTQEAQNV